MIEILLDQHLQERDRHYQEWEDYYDALDKIQLEKENDDGRQDERDYSPNPDTRD